MSAKEYYEKYGYQRNQPGWEDLTNTDKDLIKDQYPFYKGPGGREQDVAQDIWDRINQGPDVNIWRGLSERLGIKPGAIKQFAMGKFGELMKRPDFAKEYGLSKKALQQQLMDEERTMAGQFASRGLLDSSAHAAAVGGAMGGFSQSLADLMLGRAQMEEGAYQNRLGIAGGFLGQGLNFADTLNAQYLQDIGLRGEALNYLSSNRAQRNQFNLQRYGINPNPNDPFTFGDALPGLVQIGAAAASGGGGYNFGDIFSGGGAGGGGGGGSEDFFTDQQLNDLGYRTDFSDYNF